MKFLVNAQLPRQMAQWLGAGGHDAMHTLGLPAQNRTPDRTIMVVADQGDRVVVTKDDDFAESQERGGPPKRLLHVKTGNISYRQLRLILDSALNSIVMAFDNGALSVRMTKDNIEIVRADVR